MGDIIIGFIYIGMPVLLLGLGFIVGSTVEKNHIKDLDQREEVYRGIMQMNIKRVPSNWKVTQGTMVQGQAVIGGDYFKTFASQIRNLFGGEMRSLESLLVRARREARLRMLEEARAQGANCIINIREETSNIARGSRKQGITAAEIFVYGTALKVQ